MIKEILAILNNSEEIKAAIGDKHIFSYLTDYRGECIIYQYLPQNSDKIVERGRIQISIISRTLEKALQLEGIVKQLLLTLGDEQLTANILKVEHNGGGSLYDYDRQMYHHYLYLDIISRSEKYYD